MRAVQATHLAVLTFAPQSLVHSVTVKCPHSVSVLLKCFISYGFSLGLLACTFEHYHLNAEIQKAPMKNPSSFMMLTLADAPEETDDHDCVERLCLHPILFSRTFTSKLLVRFLKLMAPQFILMDFLENTNSHETLPYGALLPFLSSNMLNFWL